MQTVNIELLRNSVALTITMRAFANRRQGDMGGVQVNADKRRLSLSKKLIESDEYDAIRAFQTEVYQWCVKRSVPSYFKDGLYLVKLSEVQNFEDKLRSAVEKLQSELLPAFVQSYPRQVEDARTVLNGQFKESDYPATATLPARFGIEWNWIAFGVPETLPEELRQAEAMKIESTFREAEKEILAALREGFSQIVSHVTDRLTVAPGEKPKVFRNTLFEDLTEFIDTFNARNLVNDAQLEAMVSKARAILAEVRGATPSQQAELVRDSQFLRDETARKFQELKTAVDGIIIDKPSRRFDLSE